MKKGFLYGIIAIISMIGFMSFTDIKKDVNKKAAEKFMASTAANSFSETCFNSFFDWPPGLPTSGVWDTQSGAQTAANNFATTVSVQYKVSSISTGHVGPYGWYYIVCYR